MPTTSDKTLRDGPAIQPVPSPVRDTLNFCTQYVNLRLVPVHTLKIGDYLVKGGDKKNAGLYASCKKVPHNCLCYYWKCGDNICYVGSATPYKHHKISLLGRVLNYLQNHTANKNGDAQVNRRIFNNVNELLKAQQVEFGIFEFDWLTIRDCTLSFNECSTNPDVIVMLEYTLICHYKLLAQVEWNK